ncbi:cytochrome c biogenesis protein ResB [Nocardioides sp. CBS4Y-1]|uniref:Cytochrome c biogenesis protein ResB n=2 Tax=Nocardioides acrostichi TaxID=2784339 RepID=A0A930V4K0_9ACTN|nr:cytochrome c biogenesis protein ResB [Nocardioides acrostichi]
MRTALVLLLLLALAAVPGSLIPQTSVDSFNASQWKDRHETLAPLYEKLGLFDVYGSTWFAAVYVLLMVSLVGCIVPRCWHYARGIGAQPPAAPARLTRLPDHESLHLDQGDAAVLERARAVLRRRRYRLRRDVPQGADWVAAERGYLREVGNLVFHLSVIVVLVGFAMGNMLGYKGAVILRQGETFSNNLTQYDDFVPGSLFDASNLDPFSFDIEKFDVQWRPLGPNVRDAGQARGYQAHMVYRTSPGAAEQTYDLRVNHPLDLGSSEVFLVGHGYAPIITVRDANGDKAWTGPVNFLPQDASFFSFGVVKAIDAKPDPIGLQGFLYPYFASIGGDPVNLGGQDANPVISMNVFTGDLGLEDGQPQSVYVLDTAKMTQLMTKDADTGKQKPLRLDLAVGDTAKLPNGLGSVTFDGIKPWVRVQISRSPGKDIALGGVVLALIGLCGSLFVRPRRVWVRARPNPEGGTDVEVAVLDRSGGGDTSSVLASIVESLRPGAAAREEQT